MKLKPWIIVLFALAVIAAVADYVVTVEAVYKNPSGDSGRIYHLFHEPADEIPIFGSSKVYYDYDPDEMGINAYNYGLPGSSYDVTDTFLKIELAKSKTTPIIIDLKPEANHGIGDPSTYIPFVFDGRIQELLERSHSMEWQYHLPGVRYFGYYDYFLKELINNRFHTMRSVVRGFSHEKYWTFDRQRLDNAIQMRLHGVNGYFPDEDQNRRLLAHIKDHPERLFLLVYSPVHPSCFANFKNLDQFNAYKTQMASFPNVVVLDYEQMDLPDESFKDTNHLLYDGAVKFSRTLGAKINDILKTRGATGDAYGKLARRDAHPEKGPPRAGVSP